MKRILKLLLYIFLSSCSLNVLAYETVEFPKYFHVDNNHPDYILFRNALLAGNLLAIENFQINERHQDNYNHQEVSLITVDIHNTNLKVKEYKSAGHGGSYHHYTLTLSNHIIATTEETRTMGLVTNIKSNFTPNLEQFIHNIQRGEVYPQYMIIPEVLCTRGYVSTREHNMQLVATISNVPTRVKCISYPDENQKLSVNGQTTLVFNISNNRPITFKQALMFADINCQDQLIAVVPCH